MNIFNWTIKVINLSKITDVIHSDLRGQKGPDDGLIVSIRISSEVL